MNFSVLPSDDVALQWFQQKTRAGICSDARGLAAIDGDGRIRGVVIFDRWTFSACQAHVMLATAAAGRALMREAADFVFRQAGRRMMLGTVAKSNRRSLNLALRLGFHVHHVIKDGFAEGDDLVLLELRRENCRWLGKERQAA